MQLTMIRHLPTEWNKNQILQGRRDIPIAPITEEWRKGMNRNLSILRQQMPFDLVLASSLKRTQQTARLYEFEPEIDPLLDELDFGPFEGKPREKLMETYGETWIENPKALLLGESILQLEERLIAFLQKYRSYKKVLIFGHGSWIRAMLSYAEHGHVNHMNKVVVPNNTCKILPEITIRSEG